MHRIQELRRHERTPLDCSVRLLDTSGRVLVQGRACDVSTGGVRVSGERRLPFHDGQACWVELSVPRPYKGGPRRRVIKLMGDIRRGSGRGDDRQVTVSVVFVNNFSPDLLSPLK
ncbi:MAG: hypothetical protein AMK72_06445 [Planctomycetes bacterium SM23_25]|nr:MAG: hypothetical protein AMS14_08325 [Planctomycetes bacterium DG_20]KPK48634.1 MAG: hypothetical protein AMK72_06445 [Planctomycetes bacterium SM23_25]